MQAKQVAIEASRQLQDGEHELVQIFFELIA